MSAGREPHGSVCTWVWEDASRNEVEERNLSAVTLSNQPPIHRKHQFPILFTTSFLTLCPALLWLCEASSHLSPQALLSPSQGKHGAQRNTTPHQPSPRSLVLLLLLQLPFNKFAPLRSPLLHPTKQTPFLIWFWGCSLISKMGVPTILPQSLFLIMPSCVSTDLFLSWQMVLQSPFSGNENVDNFRKQQCLSLMVETTDGAPFLPRT